MVPYSANQPRESMTRTESYRPDSFEGRSISISPDSFDPVRHVHRLDTERWATLRDVRCRKLGWMVLV